MKILCYSPAFHPNMGGLETVMEMLAEGFAGRGHAVRLVSTTPEGNPCSFPFEVIRSPGARDMLRLLRWADVYFQGNISLKGLWPLLLVRRPFVASHHGWYCTSGRPCAFRERIKHWVTRFAINTAISEAVARHIPAPSTVIPNGYREDLFIEMPDIRRHRDLVFVGRLVSDKGADMLPLSLASLRERGLRPALTIVGGGPEEPMLREQVRALRLNDQVRFAGVVRGRELAQLLNAHRIMVVPSRCEEAFGIVALEGIACGCVIVGSAGGGLPEAIGTCGLTFPNGDIAALTERLQLVLTDTDWIARFRADAKEHLARHTRAKMVDAYLHVLEGAVA